MTGHQLAAFSTFQLYDEGENRTAKVLLRH